jgi:hypothetical protein
VRSSKKGLENFDFSKYLFDLDRLKDFDDTFLVINGIASLINL